MDFRPDVAMMSVAGSPSETWQACRRESSNRTSYLTAWEHHWEKVDVLPTSSPWFLRNGLRSQRTRDGYVQANHLTCCWINFAKPCRFCSSRLAPFAICSAALRLDSTTGCAAFRQQSPQIAFTRCNEKHKSRKLTKIGLSFGGGFPLQGAGYGDAGAFRKSA